MQLDAGVVTIRDGRTGVKKDKHAILKGAEPLMVGDKIFVDVNLLEDDGSDAPDPAPADIKYELTYDGQTDITFTGEVPTADVLGDHWLLGGQGARKLAKAQGNAVVVRLHGGAPGGQHRAEIIVRIGDLEDRIVFPRVD